MRLTLLLSGIGVAAALTGSDLSQAPPTLYYTTNCVKVKARTEGEIHQWVTGPLREHAQDQFDSGAITTWLLIRAVQSEGSPNDCDYEVVTFYLARPPEPLAPEEINSLLKRAARALTPEQFSQFQDSLSEPRSSTLFQTLASTGHVEKGDFLSFKYVKVKDRSQCYRKWIELEEKAWKPRGPNARVVARCRACSR